MKNKTREDEVLLRSMLLLNIKMMGLVIGLLFGLAIFVATNWLVLKNVLHPETSAPLGPHLQLLSQFFLGYRVSFLGSFIGFFYGFAVGTLGGTAVGWIYNKIVKFRH